MQRKLLTVVFPIHFVVITANPEAAKVASVDASKKWKVHEVYKHCKDPKVVDPPAIAFLVFDSWSEKKQFDDIDRMGGRSGNRPVVALDYERLGHQNQSPEEHEMGHAFGLMHVCTKDATLTTPSNIMGSHENCDGANAGMRNLGFDEKQMARIQDRIVLYQKTLALR